MTRCSSAIRALPGLTARTIRSRRGRVVAGTASGWSGIQSVVVNSLATVYTISGTIAGGGGATVILSGDATDIQIANVTQAADMLTTKCTVDSTETDSSTAAAAPVIDSANDDVATADQIRIDVDAVSTTAAKGLYVELTFQNP